ncbi:MAG TPA: hypothetical protein VH186_18935 [Chloroflexia bacterium]|nr:hypothetical protein [Chloroflexia bacterium]
MNHIKDFFLYILALIVLLAPAIILGWIGFSLLSWPGLVIGVIAGFAIFVFSVNKIQAQDDDDFVEEAGTEALPEHSNDNIKSTGGDKPQEVK